MRIDEHTVYDSETEKCKPAHEYATCEICNIYWQKLLDNESTTKWLRRYHNQAQEMLKKQSKLIVEINNG